MEWSVLNWNEPAIRFYRRMGARAMDEWTVFRVTGEASDQLAMRARRFLVLTKLTLSEARLS